MSTGFIPLALANTHGNNPVMEDDIKKQIIERVQVRMKDLGLSMRAVGVSSGHGPDLVRDWLRAKGLPRLDSLIKVAVVLKTTPDWLAFGNGPKENPADSTPDSTSNEAIIARTHEARTRANITLADAAKALGVTEAQYKKFETTTPIAPNLVFRFCNLTRISADWLFSGESGDISEASSTSQREAS